jgi:protein-L-isoaspartate O-methyltransferase
MTDRTPYWLGERPAEDEFERLEQQATLSDPAMRARLSAWGLRPGMRCLEVGPGTGVDGPMARRTGGNGHDARPR